MTANTEEHVIEVKQSDLVKIALDIRTNPKHLRAYLSEVAAFGITAYSHVPMNSAMKYVDDKAAAILADVDDRKSKIMLELTQLLGANGKLLHPFKEEAKEHRKELLKALDTVKADIDPDSKSGKMGKAMSALESLVDPSSPNSLDKRIEHILETQFAEDGILVEAFGKKVSEHYKEMADNWKEVRDFMLQEKVIQATIANTPLKGKPFEQRVHHGAKDWAIALGGNAEHTGPDNKPGDVVVQVPMITGKDIRIAVEAKNEATPRGRAYIAKKLDASMTTRNCDHAVWISASTAGLALEIGDFDKGITSIGPWIATTEELLHLALRTIKTEEEIRRQQKAGSVTDAEAQILLDLCKPAQEALKLFKTSNTELGKIEKSTAAARQCNTAIKSIMETQLNSIEARLKATHPSK